jgi:hypothetical protein
MSNNELSVVETNDRALVVRQAIELAKKQVLDGFLHLGRLLKEARDNEYHRDWGYTRFDNWVNESAGLDMSPRQAYYLINAVELIEQHQLTDEQAERIGISKLKLIASGSSVEGAEQEIQEMLNNAADTPLSEVRDSVARIKNARYVYRNLRFEADAIEQIWDPAVERARAEHGGYTDAEGNAVDITESQAAIYFAAGYLAGPIASHSSTPALEGDFEDVIDEGERVDA